MDPTRKMRALVIEDDSEMANLVAALLRRKFSIEAEIAPDCATAHRLLTAEDFDLITLDYRLPDGAGLDLLDEITEPGASPVIMVTGYGDEETAARSFRSRASGYVVKDNRLPAMLSGAVEKPWRRSPQENRKGAPRREGLYRRRPQQSPRPLHRAGHRRQPLQVEPEGRPGHRL